MYIQLNTLNKILYLTHNQGRLLDVGVSEVS